MSEPLVMALGITIVGMTLLFLTLLLFYGLLSLLTIVFKAPAPTSGEGVGGSGDSPAGEEPMLRAAAIAVALARTEAERANLPALLPEEGAAASPWWVLHQQRQLTHGAGTRRK